MKLFKYIDCVICDGVLEVIDLFSFIKTDAFKRYFGLTIILAILFSLDMGAREFYDFTRGQRESKEIQKLQIENEALKELLKLTKQEL